MQRRLRQPTVLALVLAGVPALACTADAPSYAAFTVAAELSDTGTTSSSSASSDAPPPDVPPSSTTTGSSETTLVGSESDGESGTTGDDGKAVPLAVELILTPPSVGAVGEVQIDVWTSRPVASIDLFDDDEPLVLGATPKSPLTVLEVTSDDVPGDGLHTIRAVAHAADGVSGQDEKDLSIDVAPGGTDVWPPHVTPPGPFSGYTGVALLDNNSIAASGFLETQQGLMAVVVQLDGATGKVEAGPVSLGKVAIADAGSGPAIATGDDGSVYVASTRSGPTWAVSKVRPADALPMVWTAGDEVKSTKAFGVALADDRVVVVGAAEVAPGTHDLKVWWVSAEDGEVLLERTFAASPKDDKNNVLDELGRGVAVVGDQIVVVGERVIKGELNDLRRRAVMVRYSLDGELLGEWTSGGGQLEEDGAMGVAALRDGGFVLVGWGRDLFTIRQVMTRWFSATYEPGPVRIESTPGSDAIAYAIDEDREGKLVIAGSRKAPATDADAWIFAIPGPLGDYAWEVVRSGPGKGPDVAAALKVGPWGHVSVVGSEFAELQPRAFALQLYP